MPAFVDDSTVAWADERGGIRLLDHGRPGDLGAGGKPRPPQDACFDRPLGIVEYDRAALLGRGGGRAPWLRQPARNRVVQARHRDDETKIDDLDRLVGRRMAVTAIVLLVETDAGGLGIAGQIIRAANRNRDGVLLPAIAQIGGEVETAARQMIARERFFPAACSSVNARVASAGLISPS